MTTSLSTMATMRSSGRTWAETEVARSALPSSKAPSVSGRRVSESLIFTFTITLYAFVEECLSSAADNVAESFEHHLQEHSDLLSIVEIQVETVFVVINQVVVRHDDLVEADIVICDA